MANGNDDVADALGHQLTGGVQGLALHSAGGRAAQKALDHAQRRNGDGRGNQVGQGGNINAVEQQAVRRHELLGNGAHLSHGGAFGHRVQHEVQHHRHDDGHQRAGQVFGELFGPQDHHRHGQHRKHHRLHIGGKAQPPVGEQLLDGILALAHGAEEVIHLAQCNHDGDAGGKAGDDRHRNDGHQLAHPQHSGHKQDHTGEQSGGKHALHPVFGRDADENGCHGAGGAADLVGRTAQNANHNACHDGGDHAAGRVRAAAYAEGKGQGQSHRRNGQAGHQVGQERRAVVAGEFTPKIPKIGFHFDSFPSSVFAAR